MEDFFRSIGMRISLKELGVKPTEDQIQSLADGCWRASGCCKLGTIKPLDKENMANIYLLAR